MIERYKKRFKLEEMAHIGDVNQLSIDLYTDHNPPHFHVKKKDCFELKFSIKDLKQLDYVWQKNNKQISSKELKDLNSWLNSKTMDNKKITNYEAIKLLWNMINSGNKL